MASAEPAHMAAEAGTNLLAIAPTSEAQPQIWRYTLTEPAGNWWEADYDDSAWREGVAPFAREGTPGVRVGSEWLTGDIWLRRSFDWDGVIDEPLVLRVYHDEDAVVYLNGVKAASLPGWRSGYVERALSREAAGVLKAGRNVLAVHCHQTNGGQGVDAGLYIRRIPEASLRRGTRTIALELDGDQQRIALRLDGQVAMQSPKDGLWSIGVGWHNGEPADWAHGRLTNARQVDAWLVIDGEVDVAGGRWLVRDHYRLLDRVVKCVRQWRWEGEAESMPTTLSVRWLTPGQGKGVVMPGVLYHGNPSGAASKAAGWSGLVPIYEGRMGERLFVEEHRLTAPFVSLEWKESSGAGFGGGAALHALPSPVPFANNDDQWWTLGLERKGAGTEFALTSGVCVLNGETGVVKSGQRHTSAFDEAYVIAAPGSVIEKTFYLEAYDVAPQGSGFRTALATSIDLLQPYSTAGMPSVEEIVRDKYRFALRRWRGENTLPGFAMYPHDPDLYVMGWAGQSEAPGYALLQLADELGEAAAVEMASRCLDTLARSPFNEDGFLLACDGKTGEWSRQDPISQGQAMTNFARAIRAGRDLKIDTGAWEVFLQRACEVHARRILADGWHPVSTNEGFLVAPLCLGYELFGDDLYAEAARKAADHYGARHPSMEEPYWGGTLDARCEDKEGAWAGFEAFLAMYEMTGEQKYLDWAGHAADVALSYTVLWDMDLPAGRLRDHNLKTHGWTSVSVQNMHLDVYGVLYAPELHHLGELTGREDLKQLALVMYRSCGQMIDAWGSQGEQLQQTRFWQGGRATDPEHYRGGYAEEWTVFWITAHFLNAAAKFDEMGVLDGIWGESEVSEAKDTLVITGEATTSDGVTIVYDVRGSGETTLVFIHGWACNRSFWNHQLDVFAEDYQVVSLDLPGHGESGTNREMWTTLALADGAEAVIEKLNLSRVVLVGHSMGGWVSLETAARLPDRVIGVVGVDTLQDADFEYPEEAMAQFVAAFEADYEGTLRGMMAGMAGAQPELAKWITEEALKTNEKVAVGLIRDVQNLKMPELFKAAGVPIRCVNAAPREGRGYATNIEGNRRYADFEAVMMEGVGHFLMMEEPVEFNEKLAAVLREIGKR